MIQDRVTVLVVQAGMNRRAGEQMMQGSISIFDFQYTKKVAAMGICDYNERKKRKPKE